MSTTLNGAGVEFAPRPLTYQYHDQHIRRALLLMQDIFYQTIPNHAVLIPGFDPGIMYIRENRPQLNEGEALLNSNAFIGPRTFVAHFLHTFLLRSNMDKVFTKSYFYEVIVPLFSSSEEVPNFVIDLHFRFQAAWNSNSEEIMQLANAMVRGLDVPEPAAGKKKPKMISHFSEVGEIEIKDNTWNLSEYFISETKEEIKQDLINNPVRLTLMVLYMCSIDPVFIGALE